MIVSTSSFGVIGSRDGLKNRFRKEFQFKSENEDLTIWDFGLMIVLMKVKQPDLGHCKSSLSHLTIWDFGLMIVSLIIHFVMSFKSNQSAKLI